MPRKSNSISSIDAVRNQSPFVRTHHVMKHWIEEGILQPGDRLPSELDLAKRLDVSRTTIRSVLAQMDQEGLLQPLDGRGRVICRDLPVQRRALKGSMALLSEKMMIHQYSHHHQAGWSDFIRLGVLEAASAREFHVLILNLQRLMKDGIEHLMSEGLIGLVAVNEVLHNPEIMSILSALRKEHIPMVLQADGLHQEEYDQVLSDHICGSGMLVDWLVAEKNCRHILRVWETKINAPQLGWIDERNQGYEEACHNAGIPVLPILNISAPGDQTTHRDQFELMTHLSAGYLARALKEHGKIDAIMALTDGHIPHLAAALRTLGINPNKDILLVGYDAYWRDMEELAFENTAPVATIDKNNRRIGSALVETLQRRLEHPLDKEPINIRIEPKLVIP